MFHLIEPKIEYHNYNNKPGGICDMTIYYLLYSENLLDNIIDLTIPLKINNQLYIYDYNISLSYGYLGTSTYKMINNMKLIHEENGIYYIETINSDKIRLLSIHFQGDKKQILENLN